MYKLVIFDLDGTLVDSLCDLGNACNEALERYGFPTHEIEKYRYFVGDGIVKLIERILPEDARNEKNAADMKAAFDEIYGKNYNKLTKPYEGITELVDELEKMGVLTAVASNKPDEFTKKIVAEMFGGRFSYVSGKKDGVPKKPDPAIAVHIMDKLGVTAEETLFAGDSSVDMKTAANAGCDSIGCTWGFRTIEELKENNAVYIAHKPSDILETVMSKNN